MHLLCNRNDFNNFISINFFSPVKNYAKQIIMLSSEYTFLGCADNETEAHTVKWLSIASPANGRVRIWTSVIVAPKHTILFKTYLKDRVTGWEGEADFPCAGSLSQMTIAARPGSGWSRGARISILVSHVGGRAIFPFVPSPSAGTSKPTLLPTTAVCSCCETTSKWNDLHQLFVFVESCEAWKFCSCDGRRSQDGTSLFHQVWGWGQWGGRPSISWPMLCLNPSDSVPLWSQLGPGFVWEDPTTGLGIVCYENWDPQWPQCWYHTLPFYPASHEKKMAN